MPKYRIELITKQRNVASIEADTEDAAIVKFQDLIHEKPEGYLEGLYDTFILGPEATVEEVA